jgi:hypothetical protein
MRIGWKQTGKSNEEEKIGRGEGGGAAVKTTLKDW